MTTYPRPSADDLAAVYDAALAAQQQLALTAPTDAERKLARRWANALKSAWDWAIEQEVFTYDDHGSLIVPSGTKPGVTYAANGACSCRAHDDGIAFHGTPDPCFHRAAARLVQRAYERGERRAQVAAFARRLRERRAWVEQLTARCAPMRKAA